MSTARFVIFRFDEPQKRGGKAFGEDMLVAVERIESGRTVASLINLKL